MRFNVVDNRDLLMSRFAQGRTPPAGLLLLVAVALSAAVLLGVAVRAYTNAATVSSRATNTSEAPSGSPPPQKNSPPGRIEVELITVTPDGLHPKSITRPNGQFVLAVENRSGLPEVSVRLDSETANRSVAVPLIQAQMSSSTLNRKYQIDLSQGTYLLTEAGHPDWICRVTLTGK